LRRALFLIVMAWSVWRFWPPPDPLIFNHTLGEYVGYDEWVEPCKAPQQLVAPRHMTDEEWKAHVREWENRGEPTGECDTQCRLDGHLTCQKTYHYQPDPFTG
jgi:hypothetical protein